MGPVLLVMAGMVVMAVQAAVAVAAVGMTVAMVAMVAMAMAMTVTVATAAMVAPVVVQGRSLPLMAVARMKRVIRRAIPMIAKSPRHVRATSFNAPS